MSPMSTIRKKYFGVVAISFLASCFLGCHSKESATKRVFRFELPSGTKVLHYDYQPTGPDCSEVFVIRSEDNTFLDKLVLEWKLNESDEPSSSYSRSRSWWPDHEIRTRMKTKYEYFNESKMRFMSVWTDSKDLIYVEWAEW